MKKSIVAFLVLLVFAWSCKNSEAPEETPVGTDVPTTEAPDWATDSAAAPIDEDIVFCCTNHNPSHCATTGAEMQQLNDCVFQ